MGHILEAGDHAGDGAKEANHGAEGGNGGHEGDTFLKACHFEFAFVLDGCLYVGKGTAQTREAFVHHAGQGRVGLFREGARGIDIAFVDILPDAVHEKVVVLGIESLTECKVALDRDVDGQGEEYGKYYHNPASIESHLPEGDTFRGGNGSRSVDDGLYISHVALNHQ